MSNVSPLKPVSPQQQDVGVNVPLRFVTAASLFDGHDASINIMRRILQGSGAEVIHLAHNRSVAEVVSSAIQEDAQAIAIPGVIFHCQLEHRVASPIDQSGCPRIEPKVFATTGCCATAARPSRRA